VYVGLKPGTTRCVTIEDTFTVEPWCVREPRLRTESLATAESIFTLANGGLGVRGCLDEGEPVGRSGTYLNGVHELRALVLLHHERLLDLRRGTLRRRLRWRCPGGRRRSPELATPHREHRPDRRRDGRARARQLG
jgi:trehalose/maltose hydrolase-like predicted phosphorylase